MYLTFGRELVIDYKNIIKMNKIEKNKIFINSDKLYI